MEKEIKDQSRPKKMKKKRNNYKYVTEKYEDEERCFGRYVAV
jgi:hypothetical protein